MNRTILSALVTIAMFTSAVFAQGTISGTVTDAEGNALPGANVVIEGTSLGAAATLSGSYSIEVPNGAYTVTASVVGYKSSSASVSVSNSSASANFSLESSSVALGGVDVLANRVDNTAAIAYDDYTKADIDFRLGGRGLPKALSTLPNVYVENGGGWDDENVYVRGFDDRYTAYLINGVPMNDMENGNLYFSNWTVLADVASVVQLQRGAGAVNLAVPSLGGTVNFISAPASTEASATVKHEVGMFQYNKTAVVLNSGLMMDDKMNFQIAASRRTADKFFQNGTYSDAWSYYFNASYSMNDNNRLEFVALGSPQIHGQNFYNNRIADFSHELARELGVSEEDIASRTERGIEFNPRYDRLDTPYYGKRAVASWKPFDGWNWKSADRHSAHEINGRENYFHKPIVQLNSYNKLSDDMMLSTSFYYSGGEGGGSGSAGSVRYGNDGAVDWDATIAQNIADNRYNDDYGYVSRGIIRGSRNNQYTYGIMSKLDYDISSNAKMTFGLDWRTAEVEHYRQVYDLLGGDVFYNSSNPNWTAEQRYRTLGDKIYYDNTNTIDWLGGYGQYTVSNNDGSSWFAMFGATTASYTAENHFSVERQFVEADAETGYQMKVGGTYPLNDTFLLFGNFSSSNLTPSLDKLVDDVNYVLNSDFENEKATWFDLGARFKSANGQWAGSMNYYSATWSDRALSGTRTEANGEETFFSIDGLNQNHSGVEYSIAYQPLPILRIDFRGHMSDWVFTDDLNYTYYETIGDPSSATNFDLYVKDVKIAGAPQEAQNLILTTFWNTMKASLEVERFGKLYARWGYDNDVSDLASTLGNPSNTFKNDAYVTDFTTLLNFKYQYGMNVMGRDVTLNYSIHNLTDEMYLGDIVDFGSGDVGNLRVRLGQPRSWNFGVTINY